MVESSITTKKFIWREYFYITAHSKFSYFADRKKGREFIYFILIDEIDIYIHLLCTDKSYKRLL